MFSLNADKRITDELSHQLLLKVPSLKELLPFVSMGSMYGTFMHRFVAMGESMGAYQPSRSLVPGLARRYARQSKQLQAC